MGKNVVVCCDGTANEFAKDHTNVLKLFRVLDNDPDRQVAFYHPGLGTMEATAALTSVARQTTKLLGLAVGYGLERDVTNAYAFVMRQFQPDDTLYMFGFSRGAYTVRAVASLLHMYGLLPVGNEPLIPYAIRMMSSVNRQKDGKAFDLAEDFRNTFRGYVCKPHFVGVWDTVSSVGWIENPLKLPYSASNPDIAIGRHAVALDERRAFFRTNLWRPDPPAADGGPKDIKQVWFPGVHSDVGGGYPEEQSGLSKYAFEWMAREAALAGLLVDRARIEEVMGRTGTKYTKADPDAEKHESLTWKWRPAEIVPKRHWNWQQKREERQMNLGRRRTISASPLVHAVAFDRRNYPLPAGAIRVDTTPW
jgi:uncharacterized protein (DUF2235 family)